MSRRYRFGLLGHNIAYSRSPSIFGYLAQFRDAEVQFDIFDIDPNDLVSNIDNLKRLDGFSVTIPFKEPLLAYLDDLADDAQKIGAVNSVRVDKNRLRGYNTDALGFILPLKEKGFEGERILVLGTGGASRAVIYALNIVNPAADFSVCGRNSNRVAGFVADITKRYRIAGGIDGRTFDAIRSYEEYDLIVNCTPVGGPAYPDESVLQDDFRFSGKPICYDLVYEPAETVFLSRAKQNGCDVIGGLSMLVRQAVESYTIWTGDDFDRDAVSHKILSRLRQRAEGDNS